MTSTQPPCHCVRYGWPHRKGSGKCIWNPTRNEPTCRECGLACKYTTVHLEPHEDSSNYQRDAVISDCCEAEVILGGILLIPDDV